MLILSILCIDQIQGLYHLDTVLEYVAETN